MGCVGGWPGLRDIRLDPANKILLPGRMYFFAVRLSFFRDSQAPAKEADWPTRPAKAGPTPPFGEGSFRFQVSGFR